SGAIDNSIFNRKKNRYEKTITKYRVIQRKRDMSVLEVEPVTGRTNQIRIHLQRMGHAIVGESVYAFRKDFKLRFKRVALHAAAIEFKHPVTGKAMKFTSPVPEDMENLIMEGN
ncbi:MAG: pseudouridine synthase, partial [Candidatus Omnitrophica bacterium]|nr:pseudouridine synthase [Candidatus Omnitrophota bacterium]